MLQSSLDASVESLRFRRGFVVLSSLYASVRVCMLMSLYYLMVNVSDFNAYAFDVDS